MGMDIDSSGLPRLKSGPYEKRIAMFHFIVAISLMALQFMTRSFENWYRTTGLSIPVFIAIVGFLYGFQPSIDWEREYLLEYISKRVQVSDSDRQEYLNFSRDSKIVVLLWGWCLLLPFQLLWLSFAALGSYAMFAQFSIFPLFAAFAVMGLGPCFSLLTRIRYQKIEHMLEVHRSWTRLVSKDYLVRHKN
jgi:hypothetical protein